MWARLKPVNPVRAMELRAIKVPVERIDTLLGLAGELITEKGRFTT